MNEEKFGCGCLVFGALSYLAVLFLKAVGVISWGWLATLTFPVWLPLLVIAGLACCLLCVALIIGITGVGLVIATGIYSTFNNK